MTIGAIVHARRKRLGWTQEELAAKAGIAQSHVSRLEAGMFAIRWFLSILIFIFPALTIAEGLVQGGRLPMPLRLNITPPIVTPGMPFVVSLTGFFNNSCLLGPGRIQGAFFEEGGSIPARPEPHIARSVFVVHFDSESVSDLVCTNVITAGEEAFGAFHLPETVPPSLVEVIFVKNGEFIARGGVTVTCEWCPDLMPPPLPRAGLYWDPQMAGYGFVIEHIETKEELWEPLLFIKILDYSQQGAPAWWSVQGRLNHRGTLEAEALKFTAFPCLLCGEAFTPPYEYHPRGSPEALSSMATLQLVVQNQRKAFLGFGRSPQRVLRLVPFDISADEFSDSWPPLPPLVGDWLFISLEQQKFFPGVRFTQRFTQETGEEFRMEDFTELEESIPRRQIVFSTEDERVQIHCPALDMNYSGDCSVFLDSLPFQVLRSDITPDQVGDGHTFIGIRQQRWPGRF